VVLEKELPLGIVRFMWSLLWCKTLVFCVGGTECMTLTGYKGLPQGSVLSPFLYNLLGSGMDRFVQSGCDFLQYADDIVVYSSRNVFQTACALVLTACSSLSVFYVRCLDSRYPLQSRKWYFSPVSMTEGAEFRSLYCGLFRCFATEYSFIFHMIHLHDTICWSSWLLIL
jgi:hypothetical protein